MAPPPVSESEGFSDSPPANPSDALHRKETGGGVDKQSQAEWERKRVEIWLAFLHLVAAVTLGLALFPMVFFLWWVWKAMGAYAVWVKLAAFSLSISIGYFLFGVTLIFLCVLVKNLFRFRIESGLYGIHSMQAIQWAGYNSLILLANGAFLDVLRVSPFQTLFYRLMGAKVGIGVKVNTGGLADLCLLEVGDHTLIGGGVVLICHGFERGFLRLAPTKIGNQVSIGLGSVVMPGCEIGDGASIAPMSYLPRGTKVPPRGVWGGNPVQDLRAARRAVLAGSR